MTIKNICDAIRDLALIRGYDLVVLDDDGNWEVLASRLTYEEADRRLDIYTDQFPHAIIDIILHNEKS